MLLPKTKSPLPPKSLFLDQECALECEQLVFSVVQRQSAGRSWRAAPLAHSLFNLASVCKEGLIMFQSLPTAHATPAHHHCGSTLPAHHSAYVLGLITALTNGQEIQHQNLAG